MDTLHIIILALVQGFTEFLPISSSAHLILVPELLGWPDQGLAFDVSLHVGTLAAVILYFRSEIGHMVVDWGRSVAQRRLVGESRLAWAVLFATIPAGLAGVIFKHDIENELRSALVIATTTVLFGLLLWVADRRGRRSRDEHSMTWKDVLFIGVAQALALIPGTSRSGITMTAGLMAGLNREAAARFSFLLSIPTIAGAGLLKLKDLLEAAVPVDWHDLVLGAVLSAISAYLCIHFFLKLLERIGMAPYAIYRVFLGGVLFYVFL